MKVGHSLWQRVTVTLVARVLVAVAIVLGGCTIGLVAYDVHSHDSLLQGVESEDHHLRSFDLAITEIISQSIVFEQRLCAANPHCTPNIPGITVQIHGTHITVREIPPKKGAK